MNIPKQNQHIKEPTILEYHHKEKKINQSSKSKAKKEYYKKVWQITLSNNIRKIMGKLPCGPKKYHIDHIIPISYGFKNNIPPEIIGHHSNLRPFFWKDNFSKNSRLTHDSKERLSNLPSVQLTIHL